MDNDVKLGRFISLILRHKPETINIKLDENGWADTKELIEKGIKNITYIGIAFYKKQLRISYK